MEGEAAGTQDGADTVLVVDDDLQFRNAASRWRVRGLRVVTATDAAEAFALARTHKPAIVVLDWFLAYEVCGVDLIAPIRTIVPTGAIVVASAGLTTARTVFATRAGADLVVDKPFSLATVVRWLEEGLTARDVQPVALEALDDHQRRHVERVLAESRGNLRVASRRLAISRNRLKRTLGHPVARPGTDRERE